MATQAGMATSKVIILVLGAGMTGPLILGNTKLSEAILSIQEALSKGKDGEGSENVNAIIQSQIQRLTHEVKQLYGGRQIMVVNSSDQNRSLASYVVPFVVVGVVGYCYMWWKGFSFSDLMYVTKRNMANAVSSFTRQLEQVSAAVTAAKKHLTQRMQKLDEKLDEQKAVTGAIKFEVGEVRESLAQMGFDIEGVQQLVESLGSKIDSIEGKQDLTNAGVVYLCHFVQGLAGNGKPELLQALPGKARLELSPSTGMSGLKELQYFKEALQSDKKTSDKVSKGTESSPATSGAVHRVLKCS